MKNEVQKVFEKLGLNPSSTVMMHGDAIVAAQLKIKKGNKLKYLQDSIIKFFKNKGTLVVPAFNQENFAKKKIF